MILQNVKEKKIDNNVKIFTSVPHNTLKIVALLICYIIVTNFSIPLLNTLFVLFVLGLTVYYPFQKAICFYPLILVYFGYTFMPMDTYIPISFENTTFEKLYILIMAAKLFIQKPEFSIKLNNHHLWLLFSVFICLIQFSFIDAVYIISLGIIWLFIKKDSIFLDIFFKVFIFVLLTVFLYHFVNMENNIANYAGIVNLEGWRMNQFRGVRDPNNYALYCNMSLCWFLFRKDIKFGKLGKILIAILTAGVVITISFSGIITLLAIFSLYLVYTNRSRFLVSFFVLLCLFLGAFLFSDSLIAILQNSGIRVLSEMADRFLNILTAFELGNIDYATSYRSVYWNMYFSEFENLSFFNKLIGNRALLYQLQQDIGNSSHNAYLDYLFMNGIVGVVVYVVCVIKNLLHHFRNEEKFNLVFILILVVNFYFRSIAGTLLYLPVLI